ncbi:MAG: TlpA family protein disulfide reductase [candidate division NC10 bacterium]|nr:TlpA family protein disulfide reductase [candidate division NC10 bacterium]MBI4413668.1 TlpA family protein disulfide reductase [candidate division NC10 bacterium]
MSAYRTYSDRGVEFLGVNVFDEEANGRRYIQDRRVPYPVGFDEGNRVAALYQVQGTPTSFFITRSGRVMAIEVGAMDAVTLRETLGRLLKAK